MLRRGTNTPSGRAARRTARHRCQAPPRRAPGRSDARRRPHRGPGRHRARQTSYDPPMDPVISRPGDGERFERENRTITIRVDLPGLSVLEIEFAETFKVDPHTHDDHV